MNYYRKMLKGGRQELVEKCKLSERLKKGLLVDKTMIDNMNSIDIIKLETILSSRELSGWARDAILLDQKIVNSVNSLDIERLKIIFKAPRCDGVKTFLYGQKMIEGIQSLDIERLEILLNDMFEKTYEDPVYCSHSTWCPPFSYVEVVKSILKSEKAIDVIKSIDIEFMKSMQKHKNLFDHVIVELSKGKGPAYIERLKIFCEHNEYGCHEFMKYVLREPDICDKITSIDPEKFKIIDFNLLRQILQNQKRVDLINCLDSEKLRFIIHSDSTLLSKMWEELPDKIDWNDATSSLNTEGLRFLIEYRNKKVKSRNDVIRAKSFNFIGNEKLWYVVIYDEYWKLLRDKAIKNGIHFFNIEKLKVLLRKCYCYRKLCKILRNEETLKLFQLNSLEKLNITIEAMPGWPKFMAEFKGENDIKKNLNFAIALHKAGLMKKFNCKFLSDNEAVKKAITKAFPRDWAIDQILMPSGIKEVGPVWNLKSLCLEKLISSPHCKRGYLNFWNV